MEFYGIPEFDGVQEFLCHLAKRLGKLLKGETINILCICTVCLIDVLLWLGVQFVFIQLYYRITTMFFDGSNNANLNCVY